MATWKKVIVSGSDISQLNNDSQYLVSGDSGVVLSGSFSGSFQGDGSQLTGVAAESVEFANILNKPTLLSGSAQIADEISGSFTATSASIASDITGLVTDSGSFSTRVTDLEAFSSSLDAGFVTEAELVAATASLSSSLATDIAQNATDIATLETTTVTGGQGISSSGDLSNLTISADVDGTSVGFNGSDALEIVDGGVSNTKLANDSIKLGNTDIALGATGSSVAGLTLTDAVGSGSFSGSFQGDGSGLTGLVSTLDISGSDGSGGSIDLLTQDLTIGGTANEIETTISGQTLTIGLPDDVTIGNNLTVTGDLIVSGETTTVNTTNLLVEDKFILLNSGSANPDEGGIVIDEGAGSGHAFIYEADAGIARWGFNASVDSTAASANTTAYAAAVVDLGNAGHADSAEYQKNGNIKIENGDIFIYS